MSGGDDDDIILKNIKFQRHLGVDDEGRLHQVENRSDASLFKVSIKVINRPFLNRLRGLRIL